MIEPDDLYDRVMNEALVVNQLQLDASGTQAFQAIFDATLGAYAAAFPATDVFDDPDVRRFINGQIRRIVVAAKAEAAGGPITGEMLHRHAKRVMSRTRRIFDDALDVAEGELRIGPKRVGVSFCLTYVSVGAAQPPGQVTP
jgi:hypothetical protein